MTYPFSQTAGVSANSGNGAVKPLVSDQNASSISFQQFPSLFQNGFDHNNPSFSAISQNNKQTYDPENTQLFSGDDPSHRTRKLSEEELQQEMEGVVSQERTNEFFRRHFSHYNLEKLLNIFVVAIAILNMLYLAFITSLWALAAQFVIPEALIILVFLSVGRIAESEMIKLLCVSFFLIFWALGGYYGGLSLCNRLGGGTNNSITICIAIACALVAISIGGRFHLQLFYEHG